MKNLEFSLTTTQENYKTLFKLGLNKDVIHIIYTFKKDIEYKEDQLYHMNRLINKTRSFNINIINDELIYDEYFRYCIPRNNGIEWCIKYEHDQLRDFLTNRIEIVLDKGFMIEKIEKDKFYENYKYDENKIQFIQNNFIYLLPTVFSKINFLNKINDTKLLEIYEENDLYVYINDWDDF
tara:strand:+ start:1302 stop:1841 length:540 start_codon:yes stop_codon:yes gene_type:complete